MSSLASSSLRLNGTIVCNRDRIQLPQVAIRRHTDKVWYPNSKEAKTVNLPQVLYRTFQICSFQLLYIH